MLIDDQPHIATAVAKEDSKLARFDKEGFLAMVQEIPFFALHVMRVLVERTRKNAHLEIGSE